MYKLIFHEKKKMKQNTDFFQVMMKKVYIFTRNINDIEIDEKRNP